MARPVEQRNRMREILQKVGLDNRSLCRCMHAADEHVVWDGPGKLVIVDHCFDCACDGFVKLDI